MEQLVYISTARKPLDTIGLNDLLLASRRRNAAVGITGLLLYDGRRFLQALEGEPQAVAAMIGAIREDPRHCAIVVLKERDVPAREFGNWAMAAHRIDEMADQLGPRVDDLVRHVTDVNVRAQFSQFARRDRVVA